MDAERKSWGEMKAMYDQQIKLISEGVEEMNNSKENQEVNVNEFNQKLLMNIRNRLKVWMRNLRNGKC